MNITKDQIKETLKTVMAEEADYKVFFKNALEKAGKSIPSMSDEEKKAFFNKIDAAWDAKGEKNEALVGGQKELDVDGDGDIEADDLADLRAGKKADESTNERMGSDKGEVGNANFNNRLKAMRDDKNSVVAFIDTNKGKKLLKVFKTQQTAKQFTKKNMDTLLNTKGVESVGTMSKKEWDAKEAKYAIESVNESKSDCGCGCGGVTEGGCSTSVNESASKEAMGISALTGTRGSAVQDFIDKNKINSKKLFKALKSANLQGRMNFAFALSGKPGNPNEKLTIKLFGEDVNEGDGLWANIRAKRARGEKPAHGNSQAHKDAVKAGKKINKNESISDVVSSELAFEINTFLERPIMENKSIKNSKISETINVLINEGIGEVLTEGAKAEFDSLIKKYK